MSNYSEVLLPVGRQGSPTNTQAGLYNKYMVPLWANREEEFRSLVQLVWYPSTWNTYSYLLNPTPWLFAPVPTFMA